MSSCRTPQRLDADQSPTFSFKQPFLKLVTFLTIFVTVTAAATWMTSEIVPRRVFGITGGDFMQFWCAGKILASGRDPYNPQLQTQYSREQGWNRNIQGHGKFDFMPYYYPPWLGLACIGLLALGFESANVLWVVLQFEAAAVAGYLLQRSIPGRSLGIAVVFVPCFALTIQAARMGQIAPSILLAIVAACYLSQKGCDRTAGACLACLTIKPQLTALFVFMALLWAIKQRRYRVVGGFVAAVACFVLASTAVVPNWLPAMLNAPLETPLVTVERPWLGTTWYAILRTAGIPQASCYVLYAVVNVPLGLWLLRKSLRQETTIIELAALTSCATCFMAPYLRSYDLVVLLLPFFYLLSRLPDKYRVLLLTAYAFLPFMHQTIRWQREEYPMASREVGWFWMVAVISGVWLWYEFRRNRTWSETSDIAALRPDPRGGPATVSG